MMSIMASILSSGVFQGPQIWAYLDPGTGSMLFQVLMAGLLSDLLARSSYLNLKNALFKHHNRA